MKALALKLSVRQVFEIIKFSAVIEPPIEKTSLQTYRFRPLK